MMTISAFYSELEKLTTELLENLGDILSLYERQEVIDFLAHGEYGLALETLCLIIKEEKKQINKYHLEKILELQKMMEIQSLPIDDQWQI